MLLFLLTVVTIVVTFIGFSAWLFDLPNQVERDTAHGMGPWSADGDEGDA